MECVKQTEENFTAYETSKMLAKGLSLTIQLGGVTIVELSCGCQEKTQGVGKSVLGGYNGI